jgi:hypothetical protein
LPEKELQGAKVGDAEKLAQLVAAGDTEPIANVLAAQRLVHDALGKLVGKRRVREKQHYVSLATLAAFGGELAIPLGDALVRFAHGAANFDDIVAVGQVVKDVDVTAPIAIASGSYVGTRALEQTVETHAYERVHLARKRNLVVDRRTLHRAPKDAREAKLGRAPQLLNQPQALRIGHLFAHAGAVDDAHRLLFSACAL